MKASAKKAFKRVLLVLGIVIVLVVGAFYIYTLDYYRADEPATAVLEDGQERVIEQQNLTAFLPPEGTKDAPGLIFYPGGKVEDTAYAPLLKQLSDQGILCVLVKMPFNLAVFNINAADDVYSRFEDVDTWYLAGHSLGGAMASAYAEKGSDHLAGLFLLGAYPINEATVDTLVIYGTYDHGLDMEKVAIADKVFEIKGGNHAYFGNYGEQKGDGTATITREAQQEQAVQIITSYIF